jgi:hypothetical protein
METLWKFDKQTLTLDLDDQEGNFYEIDLTRCNSSAEILDWIAQVSRKSWATESIISSMVKTLDHVFGFQENLCGWGRNKTFDAKQWLTSPDGRLRRFLTDARITGALKRHRESENSYTMGELNDAVNDLHSQMPADY